MMLHRLDRDAVQEQFLYLGHARALAQRRAQVNLLVRKQARAQLTISGEAQAVTVVAKVLADGRDETECALGPRQAVIAGRAVAGAHFRRFQLAQRTLDFLTDLARRHQPLPPVAADPVPHRHNLDKAQVPAGLHRLPGQVNHLVVVHPPHDDGVDLDRLQPRRVRRLQPGQHVLQPAQPRDGVEPFRVERIQADVDPVQAGGGQFVGVAGQQDAVGRHRQVVNAGDAGQGAHQVNDSGPRQRLPAGQAYLADAQLSPRPDDGLDFLVAQYLLVRPPGDPLRRHTVDTAQVAAVSDRDAQITDGTIVSVQVSHNQTSVKRYGRRKP